MKVYMYVYEYMRMNMYTLVYWDIACHQKSFCPLDTIHIHTHTHTYTYVYMYMYIDVYICIYVYVYVYTYIHIDMYIFTYIHIYTCIRMPVIRNPSVHSIRLAVCCSQCLQCVAEGLLCAQYYSGAFSRFIPDFSLPNPFTL